MVPASMARAHTVSRSPSKSWSWDRLLLANLHRSAAITSQPLLGCLKSWWWHLKFLTWGAKKIQWSVRKTFPLGPKRAPLSLSRNEGEQPRPATICAQYKHTLVLEFYLASLSPHMYSKTQPRTTPPHPNCNKSSKIIKSLKAKDPC